MITNSIFQTNELGQGVRFYSETEIYTLTNGSMYPVIHSKFPDDPPIQIWREGSRWLVCQSNECVELMTRPKSSDSGTERGYIAIALFVPLVLVCLYMAFILGRKK